MTALQRCCSTGTLTLRFGGTRKKMLVNWISHYSGRYRDLCFGQKKYTFLIFFEKSEITLLGQHLTVILHVLTKICTF